MFPLRMATLLAVGVAAFLTATTQGADYAPLADAAKAEFQPLDASDLEAARAELADSAAAVERLVNPATDFGRGWLAYLKWDGVQTQLDGDPDLAAAKESLRMLRSGADGLERPELRRLDAALESFMGVASFAPAPPERQKRSFDLTVDGLAERLADPAVLTSARGSYETERRLALLAGLGSAGRAQAFRDQALEEFGLPNLYVAVQEALLNRIAGRPIDDCTALTDCILGTSIRGTGFTSAAITVTTLPAAGHARLAFHLMGSTQSNTTGVNGPVAIRSAGTTTFSASKVVDLSDGSFSTSPATATATTRTRTQSVSKIGGGLGTRLIEKIARQRVAQQKGRADAIASDHAESRVERQLDERLNSEIADARRRYDERFTKPLRRRGATPRALRQWTTDDALLVEAVQADDRQLAAWGEPPEAIPAPLSARLHQTAVNNLLADYLGGATLHRDAPDKPTKVDVVTPPWLKFKDDQPEPGERFQPWSLRLRDDRPISVEFVDGKVKAFIHADRLRVEDKSYDGWDLIATYEPQRLEEGWRLVRQGEVEVLPTRFDPATGGRLTSTEVGLRNNLADALNNPPDRVPQVVEIDKIDLTSREGPVKYLLLQDIRVSDGWLAAGWAAE